MARVMMICPGEIKPVFSGIELPIDSDLSQLLAHFLQCDKCGRRHPIRAPFFEGGTQPFPDWNALDYDRDFASEIGILAAQFTLIENNLPPLLTCIIGLDQSYAFTILGHFEKVSERIGLLQSLAKKRLAVEVTTLTSRHELTKILDLLAMSKSAAALRNKYLHAGYGIGLANQIHVSPFPSGAKGRPKSVDKLIYLNVVRDVQQVKHVWHELWAYIHRDGHLAHAPV